jgi:CBS domain-containing protein
MTTKIATVRPDASLQTVADAFERHPFHHLPVVVDGRPVGIISDRDLIRAYTTHAFQADAAVSTIMTQVVARIEPEATLIQAAQRLLKLGVNSLLVLDDAGKLKGILTSRDIVKAVAAPE